MKTSDIPCSPGMNRFQQSRDNDASQLGGQTDWWTGKTGVRRRETYDLRDSRRAHRSSVLIKIRRTTNIQDSPTTAGVLLSLSLSLTLSRRVTPSTVR